MPLCAVNHSIEAMSTRGCEEMLVAMSPLPRSPVVDIATLDRGRPAEAATLSLIVTSTRAGAATGSSLAVSTEFSRTMIFALQFWQRMVRTLPRTFSSEIWYFVLQPPQKNFIWAQAGA